MELHIFIPNLGLLYYVRNLILPYIYHRKLQLFYRSIFVNIIILSDLYSSIIVGFN